MLTRSCDCGEVRQENFDPPDIAAQVDGVMVLRYIGGKRDVAAEIIPQPIRVDGNARSCELAVAFYFSMRNENDYELHGTNWFKKL